MRPRHVRRRLPPNDDGSLAAASGRCRGACLRAASGLLITMLLLAGCASGPTRPRSGEPSGHPVPVVPQSPRARIVEGAVAQLGRPYRYGGSGPEAFDCSGLVHFVHNAIGVMVPRTTADQFRRARPVPLEQLAAGDLLFFRIDGPEVAHVGIYAGDGRFVHAPQTGRPVEMRELGDAFYSSRLLGAGRFTEE